MSVDRADVLVHAHLAQRRPDPPRTHRVEVVPAGRAMYKLLHLRRLGVLMAPVGTCDLGAGGYILCPISASLQLCHSPADQLLKLRFEVATEALAEVGLRRSQVKHLRAVQAELDAEARPKFPPRGLASRRPGHPATPKVAAAPPAPSPEPPKRSAESRFPGIPWEIQKCFFHPPQAACPCVKVARQIFQRLIGSGTPPEVKALVVATWGRA